VSVAVSLPKIQSQGPVEDVYQEAMNAGHAAAWEQDWERAIPAYMTAIRARPDDPAAHNNLGLALLQARRLEDALKVYQRAHRLAPDDPIPLEKSADVYERMGRLSDAAMQYLAVADVYLAQQDLDKAIGNWERATRISGGLVEIHKKLALAYEKTGRRKQAVREYLTLAANYQMSGNVPVATQAVERALRLEPQNPQALNALQAIRAGSKLSVDISIEDEMSAKSANSTVTKTNKTGGFDEYETEDIPESNVDGPIGESVEKSLTMLANDVMESGAIMEQRGLLTIQAIELHRQDAYEDALATYRQAQKAGMNHPAVFLNMGALSIAQGEWRDVVSYLDRVSDDKELAAGAQHGLGIAYMQLNNPRQAAKHLIAAIRIVDLSMAKSKADVEQLTGVYDRMMQSVASTDDKALIDMNNRFFELLTGADWKKRVETTRLQLEDAMRDPTTTLIDVAGISAESLSSMQKVDEYIRARRYNLAMDEAYHVLEAEPDYLAIHLRIGEILVHLNRVQLAIDKYNMIARTYLVRGNRARAAEVLGEVIKVAPMDVNVRLNLIEMLEEDDDTAKLLPEYIHLGDAYSDLADYSAAKESYEHGILLARKLNAPPAAIAEIMHHLVDIDMRRLDMRSALKMCEQIKHMEPNDRKSRELLIEIHFRLGNPASALTELDGLLQVFAAKRDGKAILQTLQHWAQERPDDEAIRSRLAAIYHQIKQIPAALEQYNIVLNLQLNGGRHKDACDTINRILSLNPPQLERYKQLQRQLGCV
jgi:tetratricopeptide (TPR) repeat protein